MTPPFKPLPDHLDGPPGSAAALLQIAASQIGYREGANNDNAFGVWYPMNNQPWCAMFVSWAAWQAGVPTSVIPKHAYTPAGAAWFDARGRLYSTPQVGDLGYVYYPSQGRIGHVFLVERLWRTAAGVLVMDTIEGNTNDTGSSQGNGVYRLLRADTSNLSYGRPAYAAGPPPGGEDEGHAPLNPSEEDPVRFITVTPASADPNTYGYTDSEWWIATAEEPGAFRVKPDVVNERQRDVIRSRVLANAATRGQSSVDLVTVVGGGPESGRTFAILDGRWWEPSAEELGALLTTFGSERVRQINQRQLDLIQSRLASLDA